MIKSYYNYYQKVNENSVYIFNTRVGSVSLLEDISPEIVSWLLDEERNEEISLPEEIKEYLCEQKFLVESWKKEYEEIRELYSAYVNDDSILSLTLLPTESCNFACPYCFLYEKSNVIMEKSDYDRVEKMIDDFLDKSLCKKKRIDINWFGGEPTLKTQEIIRFMNSIKEKCIKKDAILFSSITTNGYLLTLSSFKQLVNCGVSDFQVTVDGVKETHDKIRYLRNGEGSFETIIKNLEDINRCDVKNYRLGIRCNFTKSSLESMKCFLQYFKEKFSENKNFSLYFRPVYCYETKSNEINKMLEDLYTLEEGIFAQNELMEAVKNITGRVERRLAETLPSPTFGWCNAEKKNHYIIGQGGRIYLCDTLVGQEPVGYVDIKGKPHILQEDKLYYNIFEDERTRKCLKCKLLPVCYGSCKRNRIDSEAECYWNDSVIASAMKMDYDNLINVALYAKETIGV